jgi:hypothetical protein
LKVLSALSHPVTPLTAGGKRILARTAIRGYSQRNGQSNCYTHRENSAHPGWVKTELGGAGANLDITEGGKTSVQLATLSANGPTGAYIHLDQKLPW